MITGTCSLLHPFLTLIFLLSLSQDGKEGNEREKEKTKNFPEQTRGKAEGQNLKFGSHKMHGAVVGGFIG